MDTKTGLLQRLAQLYNSTTSIPIRPTCTRCRATIPFGRAWGPNCLTARGEGLFGRPRVIDGWEATITRYDNPGAAA